MRVFGIEHTTREFIYLCCILIVLLGFLLGTWARQQDIQEYKKALEQCLNNFELQKSGAYDTWGTPIVNISNISIIPTTE